MFPLQIGAEPGKLGMISFEVRQPNSGFFFWQVPNSGFVPISLIASLIQTNLSTMTFNLNLLTWPTYIPSLPMKLDTYQIVPHVF